MLLYISHYYFYLLKTKTSTGNSGCSTGNQSSSLYNLFLAFQSINFVSIVVQDVYEDKHLNTIISLEG
jgi:lipoprotein NlpI